MIDDTDPLTPGNGRANRTRHESATTIRAYILQHGVYAVSAKGTFIRADPSLLAVRRQILVAKLTVRPQL